MHYVTVPIQILADRFEIRRQRACGLLVLVFLALAVLAQPTAARAQDDKHNPAPADWWAYSLQTAASITATLQSLQRQTGQPVRISDIQAVGAATFAVTYVQNTGSYGKAWWWYPAIDDAGLSKALTANNARLVSLRAYDSGGGAIRYAAVMIANRGADAKAWWWGANLTPAAIANLLRQRNARLTTLQSYRVNSRTLYAATMIANTGADARAWWWYPADSWQSIEKALTSNKARLVDLTPAPNGDFNAVMEACSGQCPEWWFNFRGTGDQIMSEAQKNGARITAALAYPGCGSYCYAALMTQGSAGSQHGVLLAWLQGSSPAGSYRQSCNGVFADPMGASLAATCSGYFGGPAATVLLHPNSCMGDIANINGNLRCVISKTAVTDSITESVSLITWDDAQGTHNVWSIDEPNVVQSQTQYPQIRYHAGDTIRVAAGGCVQTGGSGNTWKDYVNPRGSEPFPGAYAGQIMLPWTGLSGGLHPLAAVTNRDERVAAKLPPTASESELHVSLGYTDDNFGDNGYYRHDNGVDDQCQNVGPAWVTIAITTPPQPGSQPGTGSAGASAPSPPPVQFSPGSKPFDLVWDVNQVDGNGLPYNPRWFAQSKNVDYADAQARPDFVADCGPAFTTSTHWCYLVQSCHDTNVDLGQLTTHCTTQAPTLDVVGANLFNVGDYCHDSGAPLTGHLNWAIVTYDGDTYYNNWSGGFPYDDDFNIALHHADASGLTRALPGEEPANTPSLLLEFKSLELDPYLGSPWWTHFNQLAQSCGGNNACDVAAGLMAGHAVATGEIGIDGSHSGYAELHPLYSLAIHILPDRYDPNARSVEEHWEFFIRNQGTEGSCSQNVHSWPSVSNANDYYIQLPWPEYATGVSAQITAWPWQSGDKLGKLLFTPPQTAPKWTYLQFFLPMETGSGFDGEVDLTYKLNAEAKPRELKKPAMIVAPGRVAEKGEPQWNELVGKIPDPAVQARMQRVLAPPPPKPPAAHLPSISMRLQPELFQAKPSPGSLGRLTHSLTSSDSLAAKFSVDVARALGLPLTSFQAIGGTQAAFVLGIDARLWLDAAPFGRIPPARQAVDGNVETFQALDNRTVLVLGTDGNLWFEHAPFDKVPPSREHVDGNVVGFQALDAQDIFVLGTDRKLWLEHAPFAKIPPRREQIDINVRNFQALGLARAMVVDTDDRLWLEDGPFGRVPPIRQQVDTNVWSFFASGDAGAAFVLASDGKLWQEHAPFGGLPPARKQVEANVRDFRVLDNFNQVWVLGENGNLWLDEGPSANISLGQKVIDGNVLAFQPIDLDHVLVLGTDGNLWLEQSPFGNGPPRRQQIDANVR